MAVTRPAEDQAAWVNALQAAGLEPVSLPLLERRPWPIREPLSALLEAPPDLVLLTSPAAARACAPLASLRCAVACVGQATAQAARHIWPDAPLRVSERGTGADLMAQLGDLTHQRVAWIRGAHVTPSTAQGLRRSGAHVTEIIAYRTLTRAPTVAETLHEHLPLDRVLLTSPRIARAWSDVARLTPAARRVPVVCIGPTTAQASRDAGLPVLAVAAHPTAEGMAIACRAVGDRLG